jgi:ubiquinone biosynthesis protein COQ9
MTDAAQSMSDFRDPERDRVLDAALPDVAFDGWSESVLRMAAERSGVGAAEARALFPRGAVDLALYFHDRADRRLGEALAAADLETMRMRDRVAFAVRTRLSLVAREREAVRRGATLFALPLYAADGAQAIWRTADTIWTTLGDRSDDVNWYTKRAILASVYSATVLYWLGDSSDEFEDTWAFLDRRIDGVMRFEKMKAAINDNPLGRLMMAGPNMAAKLIRPPRTA